MNIYESEFLPALKAEDFVKAESALERGKSEVSKSTYFWAKSLVHTAKKEHHKAQAILSKAIDGNIDDNRTCLFNRAENYLNFKEYRLALADFNEVISDQTKIVVEFYNASAQFNKAFILAVLGDNEFKDVIDKIIDDEDYFITDALYNKSSLIKIYNSTKKPVRKKPKLE
jgi:tetratricopeptide (TPR) repeat protein